ncbi:hypothetical protein Bca4012_009932 [Brassica carinata]
MKMGRLKRHIPVYTTVIKGLASGLPLVPPKEGVPSSALVPASTSAISSSPVIDSVVPTACSSGKPASDRKRVLVANSPDIPAASPPAVSSCPDAPASGDTEIAGVVKLIPFGDSKRRKGALVFNQPDSSSMSSEDCVRLVHGFRLSSSSMPSFEDLAFSREYVEWASFEARRNHLLGLYERRCRRLSDDLELERQSLADEKQRSAMVSSSLKTLEESSSKLEDKIRIFAPRWDRREKELLSQKTALEAEVARLNESRGELVESERRRVESVMLTRFGGFVVKVRKYLVDRDVRPQVLIETQLSGVVSFLKLFIEEGILIPAGKLAENEQALSAQSTVLDQMEVHDLELIDLPSFSLDNDSTID